MPTIALERIRPPRGRLFIEPLDGSFETDSGILVVKTMKQQAPDKFKVLKVGPPFEVVSKKKRKEGIYWAKEGQNIYVKREEALQKIVWFNYKKYAIIPVISIIAVEESDGSLTAPDDLVIIEKVADDKVEGSSIIFLSDQDRAYHANIHGKVISTGYHNTQGLKPGCKVTYRRHEGREFFHNDVQYIALKPKWVEGVYE